VILVWFWLLRVMTSRLMLLSLLQPCFGVLLSAPLLLREPIESRFAIGSLLVLAGIFNRQRAGLRANRRRKTGPGTDIRYTHIQSYWVIFEARQNSHGVERE